MSPATPETLLADLQREFDAIDARVAAGEIDAAQAAALMDAATAAHERRIEQNFREHVATGIENRQRQRSLRAFGLLAVIAIALVIGLLVLR